MYSETSWLGRLGFDDNPTTAIVLYLLKMSAIGSPRPFTANSDPSGSSTLIASFLFPSAPPVLTCHESPGPFSAPLARLCLHRGVHSGFPVRFASTPRNAINN